MELESFGMTFSFIENERNSIIRSSALSSFIILESPWAQFLSSLLNETIGGKIMLKMFVLCLMSFTNDYIYNENLLLIIIISSQFQTFHLVGNWL